MAKDANLYVRKAVVAALKANNGVKAIVSLRTYGPNVPADVAWPFNRFGPPSSVPRRATGMDGTRVAFVVHGFAKGGDEDVVSALGAANAAALDGRTLTLETGFPAKATITWRGNQTIRDSDEATGWHVMGSYEARIRS